MSSFSKKKAPDGTVIIRHEAAERQFGFTGRDTAGFAQAREAAYERMYGRPKMSLMRCFPKSRTSTSIPSNESSSGQAEMKNFMCS